MKTKNLRLVILILRNDKKTNEETLMQINKKFHDVLLSKDQKNSKKKLLIKIFFSNHKTRKIVRSSSTLKVLSLVAN